MLWNPFIKRKITLPLSRASCKNFWPSMYSLLGFGYDIKNSDFKVVRSAHVQQSHGGIMPSIAEVFALNVGNWRVIAAHLPQAVIPHFWTQAFVNGKVHWVAYRFNTEKENSTENLIMAFDLSDEVFKEVLLPNALVRESPLNLSNSVCEDAISVLHYDGHTGTRSCCIWLMKEYGDVNSWSKMSTVRLEGGLGRILCFRKAGDILLTARDGKLYSYDPRIQEIKYLGILGTRDSFFVGRYSESLALLIEGEQALEGLPNAAESDACKEDNEEEVDEMYIIETLNNSRMVHLVNGLLEE